MLKYSCLREGEWRRPGATALLEHLSGGKCGQLCLLNKGCALGQMGLVASCEGLCAPRPAEIGAAGVPLCIHLHPSESSRLQLGPGCLGVVSSINGTAPSAAPEGEGEGGSLRDALSSQVGRGRAEQHVAWAALHLKFRAVEVQTRREQLELGLFVVKPFVGAAWGEEIGSFPLMMGWQGK